MNFYTLRKIYQNNRMWGDGVLEAAWYALRGKTFGTEWRVRYDDSKRPINHDDWLDDEGYDDFRREQNQEGWWFSDGLKRLNDQQSGDSE